MGNPTKALSSFFNPITFRCDLSKKQYWTSQNETRQITIVKFSQSRTKAIFVSKHAPMARPTLIIRAKYSRGPILITATVINQKVAREKLGNPISVESPNMFGVSIVKCVFKNNDCLIAENRWIFHCQCCFFVVFLCTLRMCFEKK